MYGVLGCGAYTRERRVEGEIGLRELRKHTSGASESGVQSRAYVEHGVWKARGDHFAFG